MVLGGLLMYHIVNVMRTAPPLRGRFAPQLFGISMMFVYYGYLVPLSRRIGRGFYADGIWSETGFVPTGGLAPCRGAKARRSPWSSSRA